MNETLIQNTKKADVQNTADPKITEHKMGNYTYKVRTIFGDKVKLESILADRILQNSDV
jgi:hypothetical protein